jgi:hypothetical protein
MVAIAAHHGQSHIQHEDNEEDALITVNCRLMSSSLSSSKPSSSKTQTTGSSSSSPPSSTKGNTRRSVSFAPTKQVHTIPSRRQLSKEEIESCYFTAEEHRRIKDEVREWATKFISGKLHLSSNDADSVEEESRGLEKYTPIVFYQTKTRKYQAMNAVFVQQAGKADVDCIAATYRHITEESSRLARTRGLLDQHVMLQVTGRLYNKSSPPTNLVMFR